MPFHKGKGRREVPSASTPSNYSHQYSAYAYPQVPSNTTELANDETSYFARDSSGYGDVNGSSTTRYTEYGPARNFMTHLDQTYGNTPVSPSQNFADHNYSTIPPNSQRNQFSSFPPPFQSQPYSQDTDYSSSGGLPNYTLKSIPALGNGQVAEATQSHHTIIRDSREDLGPVARNYHVHHKRSFKPGKVFKVMWAEPQGSVKSSSSSYETDVEIEGLSTYFTKVRRFVIIKQFNGHCTCLGLNTYGGKGTAKKGIHADDHAVVYSGSRAPMAAGEKLRLPPIKFVPVSPQHQLDAMTRINYAKIYTVEMNVKVSFIGAIHKDSMGDLATSYNNLHGPLQYPQMGSVESNAVSSTESSAASSIPHHSYYNSPRDTKEESADVTKDQDDSGYVYNSYTDFNGDDLYDA